MNLKAPIRFFSVAFSFSLQSPVDGKPMLLTPEESIQIQVGSFLSSYWFLHSIDAHLLTDNIYNMHMK